MLYHVKYRHSFLWCLNHMLLIGKQLILMKGWQICMLRERLWRTVLQQLSYLWCVSSIEQRDCLYTCYLWYHFTNKISILEGTFCWYILIKGVFLDHLVLLIELFAFEMGILVKIYMYYLWCLWKAKFLLWEELEFFPCIMF